MTKKPVPVDLAFESATAAPKMRPEEEAAQVIETAQRGAAEAVRRAFADTEPIFLDTCDPEES